MLWFYYLAVSIFIFFVRQLFVPIIGGWSDVIVVALPAWLWLMKPDYRQWILLLTPSLLADIINVQIIPHYILASIISLAVWFVLIIPLFSAAAIWAKLIILAVWLLLWRLSYLICLSIGWLIGGKPFEIGLGTFYFLFVWLLAGLAIAGLHLFLVNKIGRRLKSA